ncbi:hypothetical protein [Nocardia terpenica]|uniref:hypothetical protein n=1 Tax=Nocardia terpenica TaxID=455432 RepID=UPI0012FDB609|nr:hypothetical protein [Nocardia terpenica]
MAVAPGHHDERTLPMMIRTVAALATLAVGVLIGGGAHALADDVHYGIYADRGTCESEGANVDAHPGWTHYECRPVPGKSWELVLVN